MTERADLAAEVAAVRAELADLAPDVAAQLEAGQPFHHQATR